MYMQRLAVLCLLTLLLIGGVCLAQQAGDPVYQSSVAYLKYRQINVASTTTLSGLTPFNMGLSGVSTSARSMTAGVTVIFGTPVGGENGWLYNTENTATSGNTLYVHFTAGTVVYSNIACTAGVSKYILSGTTLEKTLVYWSPAAGIYVVRAIGTPTVEAD